MATVSALKLHEYEAPYKEMAHDLCWGSSGAYGSLLGILGPLRRGSDQRTGLRYQLEHERSSYDINFFGEDAGRRSSKIRAHNLDFALPTVVRVLGDEERQAMPVHSFVTELFTALCEEEPAEHGVLALSAGIRAEYEERRLEGQQRKLVSHAKRYAGKPVAEVDDAVLQSLAVDVALRQANLNLINSEMRDHIRKAHDIARTYPGTFPEMITDRAMRAITRPEQEIGQNAIDQATAMAMLQEVRSIATTGSGE